MSSPKRVVLAYSGGLDTSVAIGWIAAETGAEVIAVAADVGQGGEDMDVIRQRALDCGAVESIVVDAKDEFADEFCLPALKANALYMDRYPLVSALSRPVIVKHLVDRGQDLRRRPGRPRLHRQGQRPGPVRGRPGQPRARPGLPGSRTRLRHDPRQGDRLRRGARPADRRHQEVAVLHRPERLGPRGRDRLPRGPVERPDRGRLLLHRRPGGRRATPTRSSSPSPTASPVAIDGKPVTMLQAIQQLNVRAGAQGIGRLDMVEDRLVGIKSREIYEAPGALTLIAAHQELEDLTVERDVARFKKSVEQRWTELVYDGLWFSPLKRALDAFLDSTNEHVSGDVRLTLHGGRAVVTGRRSEASLYDYNLATYDEGDTYDQRLAKGFVEIWGMPSRIAVAARPAPGDRPVTDAPRRRHRSACGAAGSPVARPRRWPRCRVSRALRLAARPVRPARLPGARPGAAPGRAARRRRAGPDARGARRARGRRARPAPSCARPADEDVHTALERGLVERLGSLGGKLRAGRSRNDQVATDLRLYLRDHGPRRRRPGARPVRRAARPGRAAPATRAAPGMTHLQHAQPIVVRAPAAGPRAAALRATSTGSPTGTRRTSVSPLGSGALAGSTLPLDPEATARELGFAKAAANSIDAVSDRDFAAEFLFVAAMIGVHLSRLGEEVVLWSSREFRWVELDDAFSTGSSIMPQKKNPDVAELARGKSGRLIGAPDRAAGRRSRACRWPTTATCRRTRSRSSTRSTRCSWCCRPPPA